LKRHHTLTKGKFWEILPQKKKNPSEKPQLPEQTSFKSPVEGEHIFLEGEGGGLGRKRVLYFRGGSNSGTEKRGKGQKSGRKTCLLFGRSHSIKRGRDTTGESPNASWWRGGKMNGSKGGNLGKHATRRYIEKETFI